MTELTLTLIEQLATRETRFALDARQQQLTEQWLSRNQAALQTDLLQLRLRFDADFCGDKSRYPLGYCKEISDGVFNLLQQSLAQSESPGLQAIRGFLQAGGRIKRVWGNLRDCYFQNALQMGGLYVDVANDSVVISKPKIEILPLAEANFNPINSYSDYAKLAQNYWQGEVFPNRYIPQLAILFPIILRYPSGKLKLHCPYQSLLYQNLLADFKPAETFLFHSEWHQKCLPDTVFETLQTQVRKAQAPSHWLSNGAIHDQDLNSLLLEARRNKLRLDARSCQQRLDYAHSINAQ